MSKPIYYYKIDKDRNPIPGSLQAFPSKPKNGFWVRLGGALCCSELARKVAVVSGNLTTATQAVVTLGCVGVVNPPKITVPLTVGDTPAVKASQVLASIHVAFDPSLEISVENGSTYVRGLKCPSGVVFTIAYSVAP